MTKQMLFFFFVLIISHIEAKRSLEGLSQCGAETSEECLVKHRLCEISDGGNELCGPCQLGYIETNGPSEIFSPKASLCVPISNITWEPFAVAYEPIYSDNAKDIDSTQRQELLRESAELISERNARNNANANASYQLGLTPFSADSPEEYRQRSGYFYVNLSGTVDEIPIFDPPTVASADIYETVDWTTAGAVTSVKNQGRCGCSWAVGVCGAIEGAAHLVGVSNATSTSFQQLISCNKRNLGCNGGSTAIGAKYAAENWFGGVATLKDYPYTDIDGVVTENCLLNKQTMPAPVVEVKDPTMIVGLDDTSISFDKRLETFKIALMKKPISVVLKSSCRLFSNYLSGILTDDDDCACSDSSCYDHSVLMVGYNDTHEVPYFKLKNSWGEEWGEDGYFRVAQMEKGAFGLFGIFGEGITVEVEHNANAGTVEEAEDDVFPIWAIATIAVLSALSCCCFLYIGCVCWSRNQKE